MKIIAENKVLAAVTLWLTPSEARELADSAADLASHPEKNHHHVNSGDYKTEVTVAVYTPENVGQFAPELQRMLREALEAD